MPKALDKSHPSYEKNLISEAVCEIRFKSTEENWNPTVFGRFSEKIPDYSKVEQVGSGESESQNTLSESRLQNVKTSFSVPDESRMYEIDKSTFTARIVDNYPGWKSFLPMIEQGFKAYCAITKPERIKRVDLRYVNIVEHPNHQADFRRWFNIGPLVPNDMYDELGPYFLRIELPGDNRKMIITTAIVRNTQTEQCGLALDLNEVRSLDLPVDWQHMSELLEDAHEDIWIAFSRFCTADTIAYMEGKTNEPG